MRREARPSATTQIALPPGTGISASSGMTVAFGRTSVTRRASMNMPLESSRRGLATRALMVMVRPGSWTTGSTKSTTPLKSRPVSAATRKSTV